MQRFGVVIVNAFEKHEEIEVCDTILMMEIYIDSLREEPMPDETGF